MQEIKLSSLIKLENITKVYQLGSNSFSALSDINLELQQGEMTAIMGASGSGKSTLMNIIGFLDHCTTGRYLFSGRDVSHLAEQELAMIRNIKIGFVFQSFFLLTRSTALQNVMLPLFYRGTPRAQAQDMAREMLEKVSVGHLANNRPNQLSGGQQQRVAIARALVGNPQTGHEVMELFINLNQQEGRTIIIITHDNEVSKKCQRTVMIKDGKIFKTEAESQPLN
jgi:putative ABC transport system ATP-binding protein